jgi:glyoxylase-like metal-dependent hydrolase (beta-lactamase superfamily II)
MRRVGSMEGPGMHTLGESPAASPAPEGKPPQAVRAGLWLFAPNRDNQGGSAWLYEASQLDVLVDVPALSEANLLWLRQRAGQRRGWIVLTGRHGHGRCRALQAELGWPVLVQEQEAYLLPGLTERHSFAEHHSLAEGLELLWTPGPSPGSCVLHGRGGPAGDGLFCGRLLVPLAPDRLGPLRRSGTFHWPRQLQSLERLRQWLPAGSPDWIASGAGLGALRGAKLLHNGADQLARLELTALAQAVPEA